MDIEVFKLEGEKLLSKFKELDKDLLNQVWKRYNMKPNQYFIDCVRRIFKYKVPGRDNITMADFELKEEHKPAYKPEPKWPDRSGLATELRRRGAQTLWEAVIKEKKRI